MIFFVLEFSNFSADKDIRMIEPQHDNHRADAGRYLEGVEVGGLCDGPSTPIVWEKSSTGTAS